MMALLKYELRKTIFAKVAILGATMLAQLAFLIGLALKNTQVLGTSIVILVLLTIGGLSYAGIQSVLVLHRDMNTKQGYMLYMTPHSSYKILGAKMLENGLSLMLLAGVFFALGVLNLELANAHFNTVKIVTSMVNQIIIMIDPKLTLNVSTFLALAFGIVSGWIANLSIAFLASVVSTALFAGRKWNLAAAFVLFILLSIVQSKLSEWIASPEHFVAMQRFLWQAGLMLIFSLINYLVTATLMEKKLSV